MNFLTFYRVHSALIAFFICLFSSYSSNAFAVISEYTKKQQIEQIIELTGFDRLVDALPTFAERALQESRPAIDPKTWEKVSRAFETVYDPVVLKEAVRKQLYRQYHPESFRSFLRFLDSSLAREMAELEQHANILQAPDKFRAYLQSLDRASDNDPRINLAGRLDEATGATKITVNIQASFFRSIFMAVDPTLASDMKLQSNELETMEADVRSKLGESTRKITIATYLLAYQYVSTKKLRDYVEQCESVTAREGNDMLAKTLLNVLNDAALKAVDIIKPKRKRK